MKVDQKNKTSKTQVQKYYLLSIRTSNYHAFWHEITVAVISKNEYEWITILKKRPIQYVAQFPATFRKSSFLVKKRILMRSDSLQTFIDVSSFIISSGGFQVVVEGGNFKFTWR